MDTNEYATNTHEYANGYERIRTIRNEYANTTNTHKYAANTQRIRKNTHEYADGYARIRTNTHKYEQVHTMDTHEYAQIHTKYPRYAWRYLRITPITSVVAIAAGVDQMTSAYLKWVLMNLFNPFPEPGNGGRGAKRPSSP